MSSLDQYFPHYSPQTSTNSESHFTPVIIVLAIIAVLAGVACILGQVFARRCLRPRPRREHVSQYRDHDMEFGGETNFTTSKASVHAEPMVENVLHVESGETNVQDSHGESLHV
ncbi:hypothetical protein IHE45_04G073500 [Dioscorea alata]|uniref:Uncharacterized protein n=1 Tax=Dioscorea alata TaxID=55571 RepID=A0ACB7WDR7_DIOAL|nr:hypothetical protein IHE45_04G073500 [Dioscorea alata]